MSEHDQVKVECIYHIYPKNKYRKEEIIICHVTLRGEKISEVIAEFVNKIGEDYETFSQRCKAFGETKREEFLQKRGENNE